MPVKTSTVILGDRAAIMPHGDIDHDELPSLRAASDTLPGDVLFLTWDFEDVPFLGVAGLHLLSEQRVIAGHQGRTLTVRGLRTQHRRLISVAAEIYPAMGWDALLAC
ncbi:STAS domain-containing protein [Streptomyces seoulensis]|uniref:STAS domain-containing protein n=1 Tax=Streptomyces seoulensis TaxID=73044 RepID=UPI0033B03A55